METGLAGVGKPGDMAEWRTVGGPVRRAGGDPWGNRGRPRKGDGGWRCSEYRPPDGDTAAIPEGGMNSPETPQDAIKRVAREKATEGAAA